jgi:hypothetical protein
MPINWKDAAQVLLIDGWHLITPGSAQPRTWAEYNAGVEFIDDQGKLIRCPETSVLAIMENPPP